MKKRTWCYILPPVVFDMRCDKCWSGELDDGTGTNITWSEYEHMIWCYDCKIDTRGFRGIFDGPIPIHVSRLLGITFDRINLETKQIERYNIETLDWDLPEVVKKNTEKPKSKTKRMLRGEKTEDPYGDYLCEEGSEYFKLVPRNKKKTN